MKTAETVENGTLTVLKITENSKLQVKPQNNKLKDELQRWQRVKCVMSTVHYHSLFFIYNGWLDILFIFVINMLIIAAYLLKTVNHQPLHNSTQFHDLILACRDLKSHNTEWVNRWVNMIFSLKVKHTHTIKFTITQELVHWEWGINMEWDVFFLVPFHKTKVEQPPPIKIVSLDLHWIGNIHFLMVSTLILTANRTN